MYWTNWPLNRVLNMIPPQEKSARPLRACLARCGTIQPAYSSFNAIRGDIFSESGLVMKMAPVLSSDDTGAGKTEATSYSYFNGGHI